jgi:hypothetical protein
MIAVVMEAFQDLADKPIGIIVSFDHIFDAVENDLLSQEYLGASGIRSIYESDERVSRDACRVLTRTENSLAAAADHVGSKRSRIAPRQSMSAATDFPPAR